MICSSTQRIATHTQHYSVRIRLLVLTPRRRRNGRRRCRCLLAQARVSNLRGAAGGDAFLRDRALRGAGERFFLVQGPHRVGVVDPCVACVYSTSPSSVVIVVVARCRFHNAVLCALCEAPQAERDPCEDRCSQAGAPPNKRKLGLASLASPVDVGERDDAQNHRQGEIGSRRNASCDPAPT